MRKEKIPASIAEGPNTGIGKWIVFTSDPGKARAIAYELSIRELKRTIPISGSIVCARERIFFCSFRYFNRPEIIDVNQ